MKVALYRGVFCDVRGLGPAYGDPPGNPDELSSYMDKAILNLQGAYYYGGLQIHMNPDNLLKWYSAGIYDNTSEDAVSANYAAAGKDIFHLDTSLRQAVLSGQNASGNPYTIEQWKDFAKVVASDIAAQTSYSWDASVIANAPMSAAKAVDKTFHDVKDGIKDPLSWPWYVWAGVAVAGVVALGPVINLAAAFVKRRPQAA